MVWIRLIAKSARIQALVFAAIELQTAADEEIVRMMILILLLAKKNCLLISLLGQLSLQS